MAEKVRIAVVSEKGGIIGVRNERIQRALRGLAKDYGIDEHVEIKGISSLRLSEKKLTPYHHVIVSSQADEKLVESKIPAGLPVSVHRLPGQPLLPREIRGIPKLDALMGKLKIAMDRQIMVLTVCKLGNVRSKDVAESIERNIRAMEIPNPVSVLHKGTEGYGTNQLESEHILGADHLIICADELEQSIWKIAQGGGLQFSKLGIRNHYMPIGIKHDKEVRDITYAFMGELKEHLRRIWALKEQ